MPYTDHIEQAKDPVTCAVLTISDTRTEVDDKSGKIIKELVEAAGHSIAFYRVVKDEADQIRATHQTNRRKRRMPRHPHQRRHRHCRTRHHL